MKKKLLILGNGFDLDLGLKSRYRDFMSGFGVFTIDGISHKGNQIVKFVYKNGEIYKGLEDFIETAMTREIHSTFDKNRVRNVISDILLG